MKASQETGPEHKRIVPRGEVRPVRAVPACMVKPHPITHLPVHTATPQYIRTAGAKETYLNSNKPYAQAILTCALIITSGQAVAADLGTLTVTAERQSASVRHAARQVTVINRQAIDNSHAGSIVDLLRGQPDIVVRDTTGIGAKSQVDLGGFGETAAANSLVLIDGRPVNNADLSGVDWTQIPVDSIERIEIIHGGGSVLYGAGAVGGVINLITRVPEAGGELSGEAGSYATYSGAGRAGIEQGGLRADLHAGGSHSNGYRVNGGLDRFDAGGRAEFDVQDSLQFYLRGNQHRDTIGQPGSLTAAQVAANRQQSTTPNDVARTRDGYVEGGAMFDAGNGLSLDVPAAWRKRSTDALYSGFRVQSTLQTLTLRPKLSFENDSAVQLRAVAGSDIERGKGKLSSFDYKRTHDGYYGYLSVGGNDGLWTVSGGARNERLRDNFVSGATSSSETQRRTTWEAGAALNVAPEFGLHLSAASSVRFPQLDERFDFFTSTINPNLRQQTGRHYGVSVHSQLDDVTLDIAFRRAELKNEIFFNPATFNNENYTDKTRHDAWSLSAAWHADPRAVLRANYTLARATFRGATYPGKTIPAVPRQHAGVSVDSDWGHGFGTTLGVNWVGSSFLISDQANAAAKLPGYVVANAVARYRWQDMDTFLRIDNLGNRRFSRYGVHSAFSGDKTYPAPEVSVTGGVSYRF